MMKSKILGAAAVLTLMFSASAHAVPVVVQTQFDEHNVGPTETSTPWSDTFTFSQYNGIPPLFGVVLTAFGTSTSSLDLTNNSASPVTVNGSVGSTIDMSVAATAITLNVQPSGSFSETLPGFGSTTVGPLLGSDSDSTTIFFFTPALLAPFIGAGTFDVNLVADGILTLIGGGGNLDASQVTTSYGSFTVEYLVDITSVSEAGSMAIFGIGLLGLVAMRRRKTA
jgi:hypothetical protein